MSEPFCIFPRHRQTRRRVRFPRRSAAGLAALALALGGLSLPGPSHAAGETVAAGMGGAGAQIAVRSPLGAYLAGAFAAAQDDQEAAAAYLIQALDHASGNDRLRQDAFVAALGGGLVDAALDLAPTLLEDPEDDGDPLARFALAIEAMADGAPDTALSRLENMDLVGVARFTVPMVRAWALAGVGRTDAALAALDPLEEHSGFEPLIAFHRALILDVTGDDRATAAFETALAFGESPRLVLAAGNHFERQGMTEEAGALYRKFISEAPDTLLLDPALDRLETGERPAPLLSGAADGVAEVLFQIATVVASDTGLQTGLIYANLARHLRPDFPSATLLLGDILADRGHADRALEVYREAADDPAVGWGARLRVAQTLAELDRLGEAAALLETMALERPDRGDARVQLGDLHRFDGDFEAAVAAYDAAEAAAGETLRQDWSFLYRRGMALERAGRHDRAIADLEAAIALHDEHAHLLNYLGYLWIDLDRNVEEGEALVRRALELRPEDGYIIDSLGWAHYRQGRFEEAVETLERAVLFRPLDPVINDHLGDAYWQVGRRTEARFQWSHALARAEDEELIAAIEAKLANGLVEDTRPPSTTAGIDAPADSEAEPAQP